MQIGFLGGALTGALIGFAGGSDPPGTFFPLTAEEKALSAGGIFGLLGGLVGLPVGAALGSKHVYRIEHSAKQSIRDNDQ